MEDRADLIDHPRTGRPSTSHTDENEIRVYDLLYSAAVR